MQFYNARNYREKFHTNLYFPHASPTKDRGLTMGKWPSSLNKSQLYFLRRPLFIYVENKECNMTLTVNIV